MKNLLGLNVTDKKVKTNYDGSLFIAQRISDAQRQRIKEGSERIRKLRKETKLPVFIRIPKMISGYITIIAILIFVKSISIATLTVALGCSALWGIFFLYQRWYYKQLDENDELKRETERLDTIVLRSKIELGVPNNATKLDIFWFVYKTKIVKGKEVCKSHSMADYVNSPAYVFCEDGVLKIANLEERFDIPLKDIKSIQEIKDKVSFMGWNKEVSINSNRYKSYKMTANQYGMVFAKSYYRMLIERDGEQFEVIIPPYEMQALIQITGFRIQG